MGSRLLRLGAVLVAWIATAAIILAWLTGADETSVVIAAGERSGESFTLATAIADVAEDTYPNLRVEVYETGGSAENARLLQSGFADFATIQSDTPFEGDIQILASLYFDAYQLIVREALDFDSFSDLVGRRVAIAPRGSGQFETFWFLADHFGVGEDTLTALPMSPDAADFAMTMGQVDAVFRVRAVGNPSIQALVRDHPTRLVPIRQAGALAIKRPTVQPGNIPRGAYRGNPAMPEQDLPTVVSERLLVARAGVSDVVVQDLTRLLFEQRSELVQKTILAGLIRSPATGSRLFMRLHTGAQQYFDGEQPGWIQENSRFLAAILYVIAILTSAFFGLRAHFQGRQKIRMGHLNVRLMDIADHAQASDSVETLEGLRADLIAMLRQVINDLDTDRVGHDEFEYFSFTWRAVNGVVVNRIDRVTTGATAS